MKAPLVLILATSLAVNFYQFQKAKDVQSKGIVQVAAVDEPIVMRTKGGLLEVSTIRATERFEAAKVHSILGADIGKTATSIRVPVVYRYHIELAPEWRIRLIDKSFVVIAPAVKPTLPVAIITTGIQKESSGVWSILTGTRLLDQLERSISPVLATRSSSSGYVEMQREASRKTVREFVAKWLITQEKWKSASNYPIRVYFSDEPIRVLETLAKTAPEGAV